MEGSHCVATLEAAPARDAPHPMAPCAEARCCWLRPRRAVRSIGGTPSCVVLWWRWQGWRNVREAENHGQGAEVACCSIPVKQGDSLKVLVDSGQG